MTSRRPYMVFKHNEKAPTVVYQDNPMGIELSSYLKNFFCSNKLGVEKTRNTNSLQQLPITTT